MFLTIPFPKRGAYLRAWEQLSEVVAEHFSNIKQALACCPGGANEHEQGSLTAPQKKVAPTQMKATGPTSCPR